MVYLYTNTYLTDTDDYIVYNEVSPNTSSVAIHSVQQRNFCLFPLSHTITAIAQL